MSSRAPTMEPEVADVQAPTAIASADALPPNPESAALFSEFRTEADATGVQTAIHAAVLGGAVWTIVGFGTMQVLRFGVNLLLTRLVAPQIFGVMAMVNLCVLALHMFSDLGIRQCVVQHPRGGERNFLNTAWTLQIVRGLLLWCGTAVIAWPAATFYGEMPELLWLIPLVGIVSVTDGFHSTAVLTLSRRLVRGRLVLLENLSYFTWMSLTVLLVWLIGRNGTDPTTQRRWQLLVLGSGIVLGNLSEMIASYFLLRGHRHRWQWDRRAIRDLMHFGGWIFLSTACMFVASQADRLVIGKISVLELGIYHMAVQLARMPTLLMQALCHQLAFPLYSRLFQSGRDARSAVPHTHLLLACGAAVMASGLLCAGPALVDCVFPPAYREAGAFLQILAVAAWFTMLQSTGEAVLLATGHTRRIAIAQAVKLIALPGLLWLGYEWQGVYGLVAGFASAEALRYLVLSDFVRRLGVSQWRDDLLLTLAGAVVYALDCWVGPHIWGEWPRGGRLGAEILGVVCAWAVLLGVIWLMSSPQRKHGSERSLARASSSRLHNS